MIRKLEAHYGCGKKARPALLKKVMQMTARSENTGLPQVEGNFIHGDAAVFSAGGLKFATTNDVVKPIPLEPAVWGAAAALHCMSDLYAVGATPIVANGHLKVTEASEAEDLDAYQAALDTLNHAGVALIGGHTMDADLGTGGSEMGFYITGSVEDQSVRLSTNAIEGDRLFITKPIGNGAALAMLGETGEAPPDLSRITANLLQSNAAASAMAAHAGVRCSTDVSGYGLLGAVESVAQHSNVGVRLNLPSVPVFSSGLNAIAAGVTTALSEDLWLAHRDIFHDDISLEEILLLVDPQINGGLILFVNENRVANFDELAKAAGVSCYEIGLVVPSDNAEVFVEH